MAEPLTKSRRNTKRVKRHIARLARRILGKEAHLIFKDDQWWVLILGYGQVYAVIDAQPGINDSGMDFKPVNSERGVAD